jgi:hypothetical protein
MINIIEERFVYILLVIGFIIILLIPAIVLFITYRTKRKPVFNLDDVIKAFSVVDNIIERCYVNHHFYSQVQTALDKSTTLFNVKVEVEKVMLLVYKEIEHVNVQRYFDDTFLMQYVYDKIYSLLLTEHVELVTTRYNA